MISIDEKSMIKTIENYLRKYHSIFNKRGFHIFILLVTAMLSIHEVRSDGNRYPSYI